MNIRKIIKVLCLILLVLVAILLIVWSVLALGIDLDNSIARIFVYALFLIILAFPIYKRSLKLFFISSILIFACTYGWWIQIKPRSDRNWTIDVSRNPIVAFDGNYVRIQNVRSFDYRSDTDFSPNWREETYDLSKVSGFNVYLSHWGSPLIAHAIASWEFSDGKYLAISIETRKEVGEEYSALLGFFRQFELFYVVGDESDIIKLRTNIRNEEVYRYQLKMPSDVARRLLVDYLIEVNQLADNPRWYNALTSNCSSLIRTQVGHVSKLKPWHWKMLVNGYLDDLAYSRGQIDTSIPFEELKSKSYISEKAKKLPANYNFSVGIRE